MKGCEPGLVYFETEAKWTVQCRPGTVIAVITDGQRFDMQTRQKGQSGIVSRLTCKRGKRVNLALYWPLASFVGSITSRCSGK